MRRTILAAVTSFTLASGAGVMHASAADLFEPAPEPVPAPVLHDWSGFYVGGHVGYGVGNFDGIFHPSGRFGDPAVEPANLGTGSLDPDGILGGAQGGFNWQTGSFVLGVEGDISFLDWDDGDSNVHGDRIDVEVDFLASIRGRLGLAFDTLLIYGTGGVAFMDAEFEAFDAATDTRGSVDFDDIGYVLGGGAEWAAIPNRFSVGVEGLFYRFDDDQSIKGLTGSVHPAHSGPDATDRITFDDAWVVRARANFHFGGPGGGLFGGPGLF